VLFSKSNKLNCRLIFIVLISLIFFRVDDVSARSTQPSSHSNHAMNGEPSSVGSTTESEKKCWTIMIFMAADNNLAPCTDTDINELETIGSTDKINVVIQMDRNEKYSGKSELKWSGTKRFFIKKDSDSKKITSPEVGDLGLLDSADPQVLLDFVKWTKEKYPAERYALILWDHGTGWKEIQPPDTPALEGDSLVSKDSKRFGISNMPSESISYNISYDWTSKTSMNIPTLENALKGISEILGKPIDLLGFDACLMQMIEVAHAASQSALYQVASADQEPEKGWAYDAILKGLTENPAMDGKALGNTIVSTYKSSYQSGSQGNTAVTLALMDLSKVNNVVDELKSFSQAAEQAIGEIDKIEQARDECLKYVYNDYIDIDHFLRLLTEKISNTPFKKAIADLRASLTDPENGLIATNAHSGNQFKDSCGVAIYMPNRESFKVSKKRYKLLSLSKSAAWFSFLEDVESPPIPYLKIKEVILDDQNHDGRFAPGESFTAKIVVRNLGKQTSSKVTLFCETTSGCLNKKTFEMPLTNLPSPGKETQAGELEMNISPDAVLDNEILLTFSIHGDNIPVSTYRTSFYIKSPFMTQGHVLFAFTDGFTSAPPVLRSMLANNGVKFDQWDRMLDGDLKPDVLKRYTEGWLLISVQDSSPQQQLTPDEIESLGIFLKGGGKLVLTGQDFAFGIRESPFLKDYCRTTFVQDDVNIHVVDGANGFAQNSTFQIFGGDGADNQKWPDEIDSLAGGKVIMKYNAGARDIADEKTMAGPDIKPSSSSKGIKSSGGAAVAVIDGYRLLFFSFGIEAINSVSQRELVMKEIIGFMSPTISTEVKDYAHAASGRSQRGSHSAREYLDRMDMLSNLENNLMKKIKSKMEKNPSSGETILKNIQSLPNIERESVSNLEKNIRSLLEFNLQHGTVESK